MKTYKSILILIPLLCIYNNLFAINDYIPSKENLEARKEFSDSKFGIFIHWGIYSMFGQGEWYLETGKLNYKEYAKAASGFYPINFNAEKWITAIKNAGAKYICFTTRHHDGFSMFDTQYSDYNIVDATPFKRDIVKELAEECKKQDLKLHLYYSHLDWSREDYYPLGKYGRYTGRKNFGKWDSYYKFMNNQLTELLSNYGPIGAIWFDGMWDQPSDFNWKLDEQYSLIHQLQPACLIGNNHHKAPFPGEDFQMFEKDLPGENKSGFSPNSKIGSLPLETCETMNGMWGYKVNDLNYKSSTELIRLLVRTAGKGANLLLNIGPQPNGELPQASLERLNDIGEWMNKYGETIYRTTGGLNNNAEWGTITQKADKIFIHILTDKIPAFITIPTNKKIKRAINYDTLEDIHIENIKGGVVLNTQGLKPGIDRIITLTTK